MLRCAEHLASAKRRSVINIPSVSPFTHPIFISIIFRLPCDSSRSRECIRTKYKIEYKSVLCQFHSIAIFSARAFFSSQTLRELSLLRWIGSWWGRRLECSWLTAPQSWKKADVVYWVKLSMKYFVIFPNDSLFDTLGAACAADASFFLLPALHFFLPFVGELRKWSGREKWKSLNFNFHLISTLFSQAIKSRTGGSQASSLVDGKKDSIESNFRRQRWYLTIRFAEF